MAFSCGEAKNDEVILYRKLNGIDSMPFHYPVLVIVKDSFGFVDCIRLIDVETNKEIFWSESKGEDLLRSQIVGWVHYPMYLPADNGA